MGVSTILLVAAVVCFILAAVGVAVGNVGLVAVGLACFAGSFITRS
jgi:hypothetical protein